MFKEYKLRSLTLPCGVSIAKLAGVQLKFISDGLGACDTSRKQRSSVYTCAACRANNAGKQHT